MAVSFLVGFRLVMGQPQIWASLSLHIITAAKPRCSKPCYRTFNARLLLKKNVVSSSRDTHWKCLQM